MNVTCEAVIGGRGRWVSESYAKCQTDLTDQLSNLFEVTWLLSNNPSSICIFPNLDVVGACLYTMIECRFKKN